MPIKYDKTHWQSGITLIELMIGLMLITMIAAIAYPSYQQSVLAMHRTSAQSLLLDVLEKQQSFYAQNKTYTKALDKLGYTLTNNGVEAIGQHYYITAKNCETPLSDQLNACIRLVATAQEAATDDTISINSAGWKTPVNTW